MWLAVVFGFLEAGHLVSLADGTNSVGNVVEFVDESVADSSPADSRHAEHQSDNQHEFSRNDKAVFIVDQVIDTKLQGKFSEEEVEAFYEGFAAKYKSYESIH